MSLRRNSGLSADLPGDCHSSNVRAAVHGVLPQFSFLPPLSNRLPLLPNGLSNPCHTAHDGLGALMDVDVPHDDLLFECLASKLGESLQLVIKHAHETSRAHHIGVGLFPTLIVCCSHFRLP